MEEKKLKQLPICTWRVFVSNMRWHLKLLLDLRTVLRNKPEPKSKPKVKSRKQPEASECEEYPVEDAPPAKPKKGSAVAKPKAKGKPKK